ncbi:hypothetical protein FB451DRAFT_1292642 [Mycena latifolia]|nr:hypothetical protein FB451DRAFT_1292642 [Mycena latifolia]
MNNPSINSSHYYTSKDYLYQSLFFASTGLDSAVLHSVVWILELSSAGGGAASFDYAVVTIDDANTSGTGSTHTSGAMTIGVTTSGVAAVVEGLVLLGAVFICLNRRRTSESPRPMVEPYQLPATEVAPAPASVTIPLTTPPGLSSRMSNVFSNSKLSPSRSRTVTMASNSVHTEPLVYASDPPRPEADGRRELGIEERLRHLEALTSNSHPPPYH